MMDHESIFNRAKELQPQLVDWRRDFHQNPELAFQEFRSAEKIRGVLAELHYQPVTGIAETGLIAEIQGKKAGPRVLLRFDMDALPIQEETGAEYRSRVAGVMHACGHDGHMAIGLGVAMLLCELAPEMPGSVVLLFQPAEEGQGGALRMIEEGVLEQAAADFALGLHIWNEKPLGWLGITAGACMAGADRFDIRIKGRGGHGAQPHLTHDPILTAAQTITALQAVVSRSSDPLEAAVLSVTQINGGDAFNVIPGEVTLGGTIRSFSEFGRARMLEEMARITDHQAQSMNCAATLSITDITPPLVNDEALASRLIERFAMLRPDLKIEKDHRVMGSEDMAYFLRAIPGVYLFIGSANAKRGFAAAHHNPGFDFDERVLCEGVYLAVQAVLELMEGA